ncbi:TetR family transcriptional regulator [Pseudonocardia parietis]|uniref:AcrR family transcriptional regulator n=1 Tax=Pseudonocardia parietis TaxID=570936 RepID=A0ABS4VU79_9PSEU|nr:TetR family transcriptional regulator [Pseudonocardia parietis]MBP2367482.1 AcrR family transcriptional regulator [Pseudonocardia parietis]
MTNDVATGRRARKKMATRNAIQEAALRLFAQHGVENVTVEEIAARADVGLRTFFNYFPTKEDAVLASTAPGIDSLIDEVRARPANEPAITALREAAICVIESEVTGGHDHLTAMRVVRDSPTLVSRQMAMQSEYEATLAEVIARRVPPGAPAIYPELCAAAAMAALRLSLRRWLDAGENPSSDLLRHEVTASFVLLADGLDRQAQHR